MSRTIPDIVLRRQVEASDPDVSAWVSANAGSGKTHVLALAGDPAAARGRAARADPLHHLHQGRRRQHGASACSTRWRSGHRSTTLRSTRRSARSRASSAGTSQCGRGRAGCSRLRSRRPGGLKVQTIHAFCTRLLHQFPFEANVAARFERARRAPPKRSLLDEVRIGVLLEAAATA